VNKTQFSERDICTKFITPSLREAGWDEMTQLREEVSFTKARIIVRGNPRDPRNRPGLADLEEEDVRQSLAYAAALAQDEVTPTARLTDALSGGCSHLAQAREFLLKLVMKRFTSVPVARS